MRISDWSSDVCSSDLVLLLGAYEPTAWSLSWTNGTEIAAVLVGGYHRQVITGVPDTTPMQISTHENNGTCGAFYVGGDRSDTLAAVALRAFHHTIAHVYVATRSEEHTSELQSLMRRSYTV